jgi:hypothetical protein
MTDKCETGSLKSVLNEVLPELAGADPNHAIQVLHSVTNRFLHRTSAWQEVITPAVRSDNGEVYLKPPNTWSTYLWFLDIVHQGRPLTQLPSHNTLSTSAARPIGFITIAPNTVRIAPTPPDIKFGDVTATVALQMAHGQYKIPQEIIDRYSEALRHGLMWRMTMEPNKPYSNGKDMLWHAKLFNTACAEARDIVKRGNGMNESRWSFPQWI